MTLASSISDAGPAPSNKRSSFQPITTMGCDAPVERIACTRSCMPTISLPFAARPPCRQKFQPAVEWGSPTLEGTADDAGSENTSNMTFGEALKYPAHWLQNSADFREGRFAPDSRAARITSKSTSLARCTTFANSAKY